VAKQRKHRRCHPTLSEHMFVIQIRRSLALQLNISNDAYTTLLRDAVSKRFYLILLPPGCQWALTGSSCGPLLAIMNRTSKGVPQTHATVSPGNGAADLGLCSLGLCSRPSAPIRVQTNPSVHAAVPHARIRLLYSRL
jgi:hypothetical protein